jgi:hypothetical protein
VLTMVKQTIPFPIPFAARDQGLYPSKQAPSSSEQEPARPDYDEGCCSLCCYGVGWYIGKPHWGNVHKYWYDMHDMGDDCEGWKAEILVTGYEEPSDSSRGRLLFFGAWGSCLPEVFHRGDEPGALNHPSETFILRGLINVMFPKDVLPSTTSQR